MRNGRKRRKRSKTKALAAHLQLERTLRSAADEKLVLYRNMCSAYWERWRWELEKRKECMVREKRLLSRQSAPKMVEVLKVHEIDPDLLQNLRGVDGKEIDIFVGRGSFGVVHLQTYRRMRVAGKELLPSTVVSDVCKEALILARFCHPYLRHLFGVVTSKAPHRIVMQYHSLSDRSTSITLYDILCGSGQHYSQHVLLMLCTQLLEAVRYLHEDANVIHNDLKCNNVIVCDSVIEPTVPSLSAQDTCNVQIVVIDFGKATTLENGKTYHLNSIEKLDYLHRYPHIAPEVIEGITKQTVRSDIYSIGGILHKVLDHGTVIQNQVKKKLSDIATRWRSPRYFNRPTAKEVLVDFENIFSLL